MRCNILLISPCRGGGFDMPPIGGYSATVRSSKKVAECFERSEKRIEARDAIRHLAAITQPPLEIKTSLMFHIWLIIFFLLFEQILYKFNPSVMII
jgi:hypothetical protein